MLPLVVLKALPCRCHAAGSASTVINPQTSPVGNSFIEGYNPKANISWLGTQGPR